MTVTTKSVRPRTPKFEITITSAIYGALTALFPTLSTEETINLQPMLKSVQLGDKTRTIEKEYVAGDPTDPILDYDPRIEEGPVTVTLLYTNGEETLGTDEVDPYTLISAIIDHIDADLSLPCAYSPAGGSIGDQEFVSDPAKTFVSSITPPPTDVDGSGRIQFSFVVESSKWTPGIIT